MRVKRVEIAKLVSWDFNPRRNDHAVEAVAESIRRFGFNVPILCDAKMRIVAGHTRMKAAKSLGLKQVPVIVLPLEGKRRDGFALADNKTAEIATWDNRKLTSLLRGLCQDSFDLSTLGFSRPELRRLLGERGSGEDSVPKTPTRATTRIGEQIALGDHVLLCGDSASLDSEAGFSDGHKIDHVFAGPPYFNQRSYSHWKRYEDHLGDMGRVAGNCFRLLKKGGVLVWNIANGCSTHHAHVVHHAMVLEKAGFRYLDMLIWVKSGANYSVPRNGHILKSHCYFPAPKWEALLVMQKPGPMPKMSEEGAQYMWKHHTDVWDVSQVTTNQERVYGHPAVCPVEIPYRILQAYTSKGQRVLDPFGGSGTTLIAAERCGRAAVLIERNPLFCDVIIERWERLTGRKAKRARR